MVNLRDLGSSTAVYLTIAAFTTGIDYLAHLNSLTRYVKTTNQPFNIKVDLITAAGVTGLIALENLAEKYRVTDRVGMWLAREVILPFKGARLNGSVDDILEQTDRIERRI